jgi:hypothetical protein
MPSINVDALPPRLRTPVARTRDGLRVASTLAQADLDLLVSTARGQRAQSALSRHRAIGMLADAVEPAAVVPVLGEIALATSEARSTRVVAVRTMGQIASPEAQAILVAAIRDADPRVQQEAFSALGQSSDASVLPTLNGLPTPSDFAALRQLELTKALIAHRVGLPEPSLPPAPRNSRRPTESEATRPVVIEVLSAERTGDDLTRFQGPDFRLHFSERAYRIRCGRAEWTLFVNADLGSIAAADRLRARPWIAGLLARWMPPGVATATQFLLMTRPEDGTVRIDVVRTDGEMVYTGTAVPAGTGLAVDIGDVERPQTAPTLIVGVVSEDGVRLDIARVLQTRVSPRRVEAVRPDAT